MASRSPDRPEPDWVIDSHLGDDSANLIRLCLPARADMVPTVRALTADLARRADFDLDAVADLRLAVDEACAELVRLSNPTQLLYGAFRVEGAQVHLSVSTRPADAAARIDPAGFGWRVLLALTDAVSVEYGTGPQGDHVAIHLLKVAPSR
jgi:serine/threonine-protein kinase RsbW